MIWESIVFMLLVCVGAFQIIGSWAQLKGLSFFDRKYVGYAFGVSMILAAFIWFFGTVEFSEGGPKGQHDDQFLSFTLGLFGALFFTLILTSIIRFGSKYAADDEVSGNDGIEFFREQTFFQVLSRDLFNTKRDE